MTNKRLGFLLAVILLINCFGAISVSAAEDTIAQFTYPVGTAGGAALSAYGSASAGYSATAGAKQSGSKLFASLNGTTYTTMTYATEGYIYNTSGKTALVPVMAASADNTWGTNPYFLIKTSTDGYEGITFSAKLGGTKKGPASWKLQYSTDGTNFTDVSDASITIGDNKTLDDRSCLLSTKLPKAADNLQTIWLKVVCPDSSKIISANSTASPSGGETAINDIIITGTVKADVTPTLSAPVASPAGGEIYSDRAVTLTALDGADIYYSVNGGSYIKYSEPIYLFKDSSGSSASISAYAVMEGYYNSETAAFSYTCGYDDIAGFSFASGDDIKYVNGKIAATSGVYADAKLTASIDTNNKYVPMFDNEDMTALVIAPDDSIGWSKGTYWQFELCTFGYSQVYISADAYSSNKGPKSMTLQYSTDGITFKNVSGYENKAFSTNTLQAYYTKVPLPSDAAGCEKLYVRITSLENMSLDNNGEDIWGRPKGNTYINNVIFSGDRNSTLKAPVTTKKSDYFGLSGTVDYTSYDGADMFYNIYDKNGNAVISNSAYPPEGISLASLPGFDAILSNSYRIDIWCEKDGAKSAVNSKTFTYKGEILAQFDIDELTTVDGTDFTATSGAQAGSALLYMKPNGTDKTALKLNAGNLRASAEKSNTWIFDKTRTSPSSDGGWIIELSTKGYKNIVLSAAQSSTAKGPRDYKIAYSTNGKSFTDVPNSAVKLTLDQKTTYSNILLPKEAENLDKVYIKIKIDGGETVSGLEMAATEEEYNLDASNSVFGSGHTEINSVEICAASIEDKIAINTSEESLAAGESYSISYTGGIPIAAAYDGNTLIWAQSGLNSFTVPEKATSVKIMLWDSLDTMNALTPAIVKTVH